MSEAVQLKTLEAAIAIEQPDSDGQNSITERPDVQNGLKLAGTMIEVGREFDELIARMATEIQELTAARDSYRHAFEASEEARVAEQDIYEAACASMQRRIDKVTGDLSFFQNAFDKAKEGMEAADRTITRALSDARQDSFQRPKVERDSLQLSPPDDGQPIPKFLRGGPAKSNVQPIPRRNATTSQFMESAAKTVSRGGITAIPINDQLIRRGPNR